jgi:hypothetical protein
MSNNQMVSVPLELNAQQSRDVQRFHETCEDGQGYDVPKDRMKTLSRIGLVRALGFGRYELTDVGEAAVNGLRDKPRQPAEQHQGEQVASVPVDRCYDVRAKMIIAFNEAKKGGADLDDCLDSAYKAALRFSPNPQASAANPAEVERLRAREKSLVLDLAGSLRQQCADMRTVDTLRAQLAEAHALLQYAEGQLTNLQPHIEQACYPGRAAFIDNYIDPVIERIRALSDSAEPSVHNNVLVVDASSISEGTAPTPTAIPGRPVCITGIRNAEGRRVRITKLLAPTERDKRVAFERTEFEKRFGPGTWGHFDYANEQIGWKARAALERKP